ncbi:hypothetical protein ACFFIX_27450 [Metabacillus herbersteinensis]|uniref:Uncharacterized protein n=1 Tax=Metabacillus herbersteinensis TaxID=283816 RepID=A0ABV6GMW4_9BACI
MAKRFANNRNKSLEENNIISEDKSLHSVENNVKSIVGHSGNANVDVEVHIETTAIAYAMLCSMYATGSLDEREFRESVQKLDSLMAKRHRRSTN